MSARAFCNEFHTCLNSGQQQCQVTGCIVAEGVLLAQHMTTMTDKMSQDTEAGRSMKSLPSQGDQVGGWRCLRVGHVCCMLRL
jgi:hypothetical protein